MQFDQLGRLLILFGASIVVVGIVLLLMDRTSIGRLPGNITFSSGNFTCFVPLGAMLLLSLLLTIVANILLRIFNR
jgi:Protein of unknown function (DUF2905)